MLKLCGACVVVYLAAIGTTLMNLYRMSVVSRKSDFTSPALLLTTNCTMFVPPLYDNVSFHEVGHHIKQIDGFHHQFLSSFTCPAA